MELFYISEIVGTVVFAISGALAGIRYRMDIAGVILVGFIVGNGGGTIRSILLGKGGLFWIEDKNYITAAALPPLIIFLTFKYMPRIRRAFLNEVSRRSILTHSLVIADAFGLGIFAAAGAQSALNNGFDIFIAVIMGTITCVGGGVIRDILCNEIPMVFCREIYLLAALIGSIIYVLSLSMGISIGNSIVICTVITTALRLSAYYMKLQAPRIG